VVSSVAGVALSEKHGSVTRLTDAGAGGASFTLKNIALTVEVIGLASGALEAITERRIVLRLGFSKFPLSNISAILILTPGQSTMPTVSSSTR